MREILFRGKLIGNGKWAYGNLNITQDGVTIITPDDTIIGKYGQVIPETVGQYTGLTDKSGKKIFEGDIVSQIWYDYHEPIRDSLGEVIFNELNSSFSVVDVKKDAVFSFNPFSGYDWEIEGIGNIHDNSDLLKGGAEE